MKPYKKYIAYAFVLATLSAPSFAYADVVGFNATDRSALNGYVQALPASDKMANDGQYRVGETLPRNTATKELPAGIANRITPAPDGYTYVQSGSDVYLIDQNRMIIDRVGTR